jgi:transcriptional regulator with XRE-family HTH domain
MIDPSDTGNQAEDVARRLRWTRQCLGLDQQEFGKKAGLAQSRYNMFETGRRRLSLDAALLLCEHYTLTLDWLFRGDPSGLQYRLAEQIKQVRKAESS